MLGLKNKKEKEVEYKDPKDYPIHARTGTVKTIPKKELPAWNRKQRRTEAARARKWPYLKKLDDAETSRRIQKKLRLRNIKLRQEEAHRRAVLRRKNEKAQVMGLGQAHGQHGKRSILKDDNQQNNGETNRGQRESDNRKRDFGARRSSRA